MFLVDSHCHLDLLDYHTLHKDIVDVLEKARLHDVRMMLSVCTTLHKFLSMTELMNGHENVFFSCGIHPLEVDNDLNFDTILRSISNRPRCVAFGETGLDYFSQTQNKVQQQHAFRKHIRIAREQNKPIIVHTRNSCKDTLTILHEEQAQECGGVFHCFTEDKHTAGILLDEGFYISFSGMITFRKNFNLREVASYVPLDRLLIETDSPYLAPVPYRGKENQPAYLREIAKYMAMIKGVSLEKIAMSTTANFCRLFKIERSLKES